MSAIKCHTIKYPHDYVSAFNCPTINCPAIKCPDTYKIDTQCTILCVTYFQGSYSSFNKCLVYVRVFFLYVTLSFYYS